MIEHACSVTLFQNDELWQRHGGRGNIGQTREGQESFFQMSKNVPRSMRDASSVTFSSLCTRRRNSSESWERPVYARTSASSLQLSILFGALSLRLPARESSSTFGFCLLFVVVELLLVCFLPPAKAMPRPRFLASYFPQVHKEM